AIAQICTSARPTTASTAGTTKNIAENVAKNITKTCAAWATLASKTALPAHACMAKTIVCGAFISVGKHFICLFCFFKFSFGTFVVGVSVWVVTHGHTAVSTPYILLAGVFF